MSKELPIVEYFHSLQGEGTHVGRSAFFIRLAGCNVKCTWCDTKESWSTESHAQYSVQSLAQEAVEAMKKGAAFIVLTGGEPLHHNLDDLSEAIKEEVRIEKVNEIPIHIETSGVDAITGSPNWITLSPKTHAWPRQEVLAACHELKIIIDKKSDLDFAEKMAIEASKARGKSAKLLPELAVENPYLFLQPAWHSPQGLELALEHVKKNPKWRLSIQIHKFLGVL